MATKLKKLSEQVMVITGASSGIGLATAEAAAEKGAKLVLAARSARALEAIAGRITNAGGEAVAVTCDVADRAQVDALARTAVERFGRIDTWVNNAGTGIYARLDEASDADSRRVFDVNYWGVVYGCLAALPHLKTNGGALITVGSEVSEGYVAILGQYVASKHAVKGFVDCLRVEIEDMDKSPVSVTLIQPTAVNTPFPQHARNYMPQDAKLPDPMIDPTQVADAILNAAESPTREKRVGTMAKISTTVAMLFPSVADTMAAKQAGKMHTDTPPKNPEGALHRASEDATDSAGQKHGKPTK